ncbi:MAG: hypothetical protein M1125_00515 [Candidatus Marsarchaeota archaeon]|nr:hypothetical protein [Candidatus Marsarchaeota archaeon]
MALCIFFAASLFSYFVILNNAGIILYSFIFFLAIGIAAVFRKHLTDYLIAGSIAFIIAGSILYIGSIVIPSYIAFSAVAIAAIAYLYLHGQISSKRNSLLAMLVIFLPDLLYYFNFSVSQEFPINIAIVGYYLLIATTISLFGQIMLENRVTKSHHNFCIKCPRFSEHDLRILHCAAFAILIILFVSPIWPDGHGLDFALLPHSIIYLNSSAISANASSISYLLLINASKYSLYANSNLSNMRIYYANYKMPSGTMREINFTNYYLVNLSLNRTMLQNQQRLYMYFISRLLGNNTEIVYNGTISNYPVQYKTTISNVSYTGMFINKTFVVPITSAAYSESNSIQDIYPYYSFSSYCVPGFNISYTANFTGNSTFSLFLMHNANDFIKAISGQPPADQYNYYIDEFRNNSFQSFINRTAVKSTVHAKTGCLYYAAVSKSILRMKEAFAANYSVVIGHKSVTKKEANLFVNESSFIRPKQSNILESLAYIYQKYLFLD